MIQSSNKLIVKDPFEMPAVDGTTVLTLRECVDLVPHCWIWNASVGYLEVLEYSGFDIFVTVKNTGMSENASSGTVFPSCMEFLITAPNATPIIDNTVTCLKADFNSPTVGQTALMSVDNTSAIKAGDLIVVARDYQYVVSEVINDTTLLVLNDGKGKEGVIHIDCKTCTPVKIFESTYCCNILQEEIDEINGKFEERKSIIPWSGNSLVTISGGNRVLISEHDVTIKVDDNLANFDNSESNFATEEDLPTKTSDLENDSGFITIDDVPDRFPNFTEEDNQIQNIATIKGKDISHTYNLGTSEIPFNTGYINNLHATNLTDVTNMGDYVLVHCSSSTVNNTIPRGTDIPSGTTYTNISTAVTIVNNFPGNLILLGICNVYKFRLMVSSGSDNFVDYEHRLYSEISINGGAYNSTEQKIRYNRFSSPTVEHQCSEDMVAYVVVQIPQDPLSSVSLRWKDIFLINNKQGTVRIPASLWGPSYYIQWFGWLTSLTSI